jgi:hypothetical protein
MSMKYKIYEEQSLLVDILTGDIQFSDLIDITAIEIEDKKFQLVKKILSNIVDANLTLSPSEMESFISFLKNPDMDKSFRWAILTNNPHQTALSFLIQNDPAFKKNIGVFSTVTACNSFLGISFNEKGFQDDDYIVTRE